MSRFDWRTASDAEVEARFNPSVAVGQKAVESYIERFQQDTATARREHPLRADDRDISYGPSARQALDLHRPEHPNGDLLMFIHGGYWRRFEKDFHDFIVPSYLQAGITVANVDYDLCPTVRLDDIVSQVDRCFDFVCSKITTWGCKPERFFLAGHSAGAHLAAWILKDPSRAARIAGAHLMSGIYEVPVVRRISINDTLQLTPEEAACNDVSNRPPARPVPVVVSVGGLEPDAWQDQSVSYAEVARQAGCDVTFVESPNMDHFSILCDCTQAGGKAYLAFENLMHSVSATEETKKSQCLIV